MNKRLQNLLPEIKSCTICSEHLPLGPNPVLRAHEASRILIVGQAPGTRVHHSSIPWNDPSGENLRSWLDVDSDSFYDERLFAIIPMGFCYPGKGKSGDLPPRPECARTWHQPLLGELSNIRLRLLVGNYAIKHYLGSRAKRNLTETVKSYQEYLPDFFPLVHPSPRNRLWMRKNEWFEEQVVPKLRQKVLEALSG